jgi:adenylate cyclase
MARENSILAILFADIANSSGIYATLGNKDACSLIGECLSSFGQIALDHKGTVIKTIGDEIMCTFPDADHAVEAAIAMNRSLIQMPLGGKNYSQPLNIYVGIQVGPVILEDNDVFGDAVNVASHLMTIAKQRQIITTEETLTHLSPHLKELARIINKATLKGKPGEFRIYEIMWEQKDQTIMLNVSPDSLMFETRLELRFKDKKIEVGQDHPTIAIGRQSHNDLVVNDNRVSRTHARIEYRKGKFILLDQSTNGTYAIMQGKEEIGLKWDEIALVGNGSICLGRKHNDLTSGDPPIIRFRVTL